MKEMLKKVSDIKKIVWCFFIIQVFLLSPLFVSVSLAASLTIGDGVIIKAAKEGEIIVRDSLVAGKARLTSGNDAPAPGDWKGIKVEGSATKTQFNGTVVEYSGASGSAAIDIQKSSPDINSVEITKNNTGIRSYGGAAPSIQDSVIVNNDIGIEAGEESSPLIRNSVLSGNTVAVFNYDTENIISAANNWWGHSTGPEDSSDDTAAGGLYNPEGLGDTVSDGVNYSPWLNIVPILGAAFEIAEGAITDHPDITLNLECMTCTEFRVSENAGFAGSSFQPFAMEVPFTLSESEGFKTIYMQFRAVTGNTSQTLSDSIRLDTSGPSLSIISPAAGSLVNRPISIDVTTDDPAGISRVEFYIDNTFAYSDSTGPYSYFWNITAIPEGGHEIKAVSYDNVGHMSEEALLVSVSGQPPLPPVITHPVTNTQMNNTLVDVSGTSEPDTQVRILVNGSLAGYTIAGSNGTFDLFNILLTEGENIIRATASDAFGTSDSSTGVIVHVDTGPPPAPASLIVTSNAGGKMKISWFPATGEIPAGYRLYRSETDFTQTSEALLVKDNIPFTNTFTEDLPPADGIYYYAMTAFDSVGNESEISPVVSEMSDRTGPEAIITLSQTEPVGPGPAPPNILTINLTISEPVAGTPYLSITPVGATDYLIVLNKVTPTDWTGTFNIDTSIPSGNALFRFSAKDVTGNRGTRIISGETLAIDTSPPEGVLEFSKQPPVKAGMIDLTLTLDEPSTMVSLTFIPPLGASVDVSLTGSGAGWTGTLNIDQTMGDGEGTFILYAADNLGNSGGMLTSGASLTLKTSLPPSPTGIAAQQEPGGAIRLFWNKVTEAVSYNIYRGLETETITLPGTPAHATGITDLTYNDLPLTDGSYKYAVTSVDQAGNESLLSEIIIIASDRIPPPSPSGLTLDLEGTVIRINWQAPIEETPGSYNLYRNTAPIISTVGLQPIQSSLISITTTDVPFKDAIYYYAVTSLDAAGNESGPISDMINYDLAPPEIVVTGVTDSQVSKTPLTPVINANDSGPVDITITLNGMPFISGDSISAEGNYVLEVTAGDQAGHVSNKAVSFAIDTTKPSVIVDGIADGMFYEQPVTAMIDITDPHLDTSLILLDGVAFISGTPISRDGIHTLSIEAYDLAGNVTTINLSFTIDAAPAVPGSIHITVPSGGAPVIIWEEADATDLAGYNIYRNGFKLNTTLMVDPIYVDETYSNSKVQAYGITAVDKAGHESALRNVTVIPIDLSIIDYGAGTTPEGEKYLNKPYIERFRFNAQNKDIMPNEVGPFVFELKDQNGLVAEMIEEGPFLIPARETFLIEKAIPVGDGIVDYRTMEVSLFLPSEPDTVVKVKTSQELLAIDPGRKVDLFNDPIIKGGMASVRLKIFNHGSAPIEILTSLEGQESPDVKVFLKDPDGNIYSSGNLNQTGIGVINYAKYSLAEIPPGESFLSGPVHFFVPSNIPDGVYLEAVVYSIYHKYGLPEMVTGGSLTGFVTATASNAPYYATARSDHSFYDQNTPILITGQALDISTHAPVPNVPVKIGISVKGFDRYLMINTDNDGNYTYTFNPIEGEAGNYVLWATHPNIYDKPIQDEFSIIGLGFNPSSVNVRMSKNSEFSFPVKLHNIGEMSLSSLYFTFNGDSGVTGSVDTTGTLLTLPGGVSTQIRINIHAAYDAPDAAMASVTVTADEGISRTMDINLELKPAIPAIASEPGFLEVGLKNNNLIFRTVKLKNVGFAPLEGINITPPEHPWITLSIDPELPPIQSGESVDIGIIFNPGDEVDQGMYSDQIIVESSNHIPYTINIFATVTSSESGGVSMEVIDTLDEVVPDADVTIVHQKVTNLVFSGKTNSQGILEFRDIPTGMYNYIVHAPGHDNTVGTFTILPGIVTPVSVLMNNIFVSLEWSVTPMTLTDIYNIKLEATFETQVPAPVLTIEPAFERLEIEIGATYVGEYKVTNHGLVAIDDVKINVSFAPGLVVDVLVKELPRIGAKETVLIPYRITVNPHTSPDYVDPCSELPMTIQVGGAYYCFFGTYVREEIQGYKTVKPKDRYDPAGIFCLECDWCECLIHPLAVAWCKCLRDGDACKCAKALFGEEGATLCDCLYEGDPVACAEGLGVDSAVLKGVKKIIDVADKIRSGIKCLLCLLEIMPDISFPKSNLSSPGPGGGGGGGGGPGGTLNITGGCE